MSNTNSCRDNPSRNQQTLDLKLCTRRTRKMERHQLMEGVVRWSEFVSQLKAVAPPRATIIAARSSTKNSTGKREEVQNIEVNWHVAMRLGKRWALDKQSPLGATLDKIEQLKASIRANVEHPFRVIKRQFGHTKVRYRGLKKNTVSSSPCSCLRTCGW
jgi:IS5 family transposase